MESVIRSLEIPGGIKQKTWFELEEIELTPELQRFYDGSFYWPKATKDKPGIIGNFVTTREGFVSFNIPGKLHAGFISESNPGDRFIMGLTRTLASVDQDGVKGAIMNGANTLNVEKDVIMTAADIYPDAEQQYREYLEKKVGQQFKQAPLIFVTGSGRLEFDAEVFKESAEIETFVLTTSDGVREVKERTKDLKKGYVPPQVIVVGQGRAVNLPKAMEILRKEYGFTRLLTEGGARFFNNLHKDSLIQLDLQSIAPMIAGNDRSKGKDDRVSMADGYQFSPEEAPRFDLFSSKTDGRFLYLQYARQLKNVSDQAR